jgi:cold shock CspA family protein
MTGVVLRIVRGQSHGFIRTTEHREVFFHRSDMIGGSFVDLASGDPVTFQVDRRHRERAARDSRTEGTVTACEEEPRER